MISVDFCSVPVTFAIAVYESVHERSQRFQIATNSPSCCCSWLSMEPSCALLTDSRSTCLSARTTSRARMRADLTSPFVANCLTCCLVFFDVASNWWKVRSVTVARSPLEAGPASCPAQARAALCVASSSKRGPSPRR
jgi:hypothetical protein